MINNNCLSGKQRTFCKEEKAPHTFSYVSISSHFLGSFSIEEKGLKDASHTVGE